MDSTEGVSLLNTMAELELLLASIESELLAASAALAVGASTIELLASEVLSAELATAAPSSFQNIMAIHH